MKIVVIGAGAAGLLAAGKAARNPADEVVIIEKERYNRQKTSHNRQGKV